MPEVASGRSLMERLGVRPGSRVSVLGLDQSGFVTALQAAGADVSVRRRKGSQLVFLPVRGRRDLGALADIEPYLEPAGAVWAVFRKGRKDLREVDVIGAGVAAGLVDNKVVRFSDTLTALRFVIPVARRRSNR